MGCTAKADVEKEDELMQTDNNNIPLESVDAVNDDLLNGTLLKKTSSLAVVETDDEYGEEQITSGFDCDRCWFHCKDKKELKVHQKRHRIEDTKYVSPVRELFNFICDKCPTEMCNWEQYRRHYWYNHIYDVIKCSHDECKELTFQNRAKLRKHNQLKHCIEKPTCFFCNKKYSSK